VIGRQHREYLCVEAGTAIVDLLGIITAMDPR
jgi:hypothetical protein